MTEERRKSRKRKSSGKSSTNNIGPNQSYTDFLCPICLEILVEPVQMPCKHELCMDCFSKHVHNTSLLCPMCRMRVGVWARKNKKNNSLINKERWCLIKTLFPERVERRLNGTGDFEESFDEYVAAPKHVIAAEGELKKEYEEEMKRLELEQESVCQKNLRYIEELQAKDKEEREKQLKMDQETAHALQKEELEHLGVTLKSPTEHQKEVLAYFKPKSPMKLRNREVSSTQKKKPTMRKISFSESKGSANSLKSPQPSTSKIKSPNHTITSFFKRASKACISNTDEENRSINSTPLSTPKMASNSDSLTNLDSNDKSAFLSDYELAKRLQAEFDQEVEDIHKVESCNQILCTDINKPESSEVNGIVLNKPGITGVELKKFNSKLSKKSSSTTAVKAKEKKIPLKVQNRATRETKLEQSQIRKYLKIEKMSDRDENSPEVLI